MPPADDGLPLHRTSPILVESILRRHRHPHRRTQPLPVRGEVADDKLRRVYPLSRGMQTEARR